MSENKQAIKDAPVVPLTAGNKPQVATNTPNVPVANQQPQPVKEDPNVGTGSQVAKATQSQPQTVAGDGSIRATTIAHDKDGKVVAIEPAKTPANDNSPKPPSAKFDLDKVNDKLNQVNQFYSVYSGKNGYNPHVYLYNEVSPLAARVQIGERSEELFNAIMNLKTEEGIAKLK